MTVAASIVAAICPMGRAATMPGDARTAITVPDFATNAVCSTFESPAVRR